MHVIERRFRVRIVIVIAGTPWLVVEASKDTFVPLTLTSPADHRARPDAKWRLN